MKNIYAIIIASALFAILFLGEIGISLYFWTEENYEILGYVSWVLYPIFMVLCGYTAVRLSSYQRWWFALIFALVAYILIILLPVFFGSGLNVSNWGLSALQAPIIMFVFAAFGGGIYQYASAKH